MGLIERIYSGSRQKKISKARRLFCQLAVRKTGYSGFEDLPEIEKYLYVDLGVPYLIVPKQNLMLDVLTS